MHSSVCHLGHGTLNTKIRAVHRGTALRARLVSMSLGRPGCNLCERKLSQITDVSTFTKAEHLMDRHAGGSPARRRSTLQ